MSPMAISTFVFAGAFGGALLGMFIRDLLPEHHLSKDSQDVVKLGMGLIGTMSALVLGFLVASAQGSYATRGSELTQMAANTVLLDRVLAHYGTETKDARDLLRNAVAIVLEQTWREGSTEAAKFDPTAARAEGLYDLINQLTPRNEAQRSSQAEALTIALNLAQMRWLLFEQSRGSIPMPFLVILGFWLCIIFVSFGLFAPSNGTVIATLLVCALSVAGAIFLILELDRPFEGLMQISSAPLHNALSHLGR